jgi:hypothetical protein
MANPGGNQLTSPHPVTADIFLDEDMPAEQQDLIISAVAALVPVQARIMPRRRSALDLQWLVLAALPLQAFLSGIGTDAAHSAYEHFQDAVRVLLRRKDPDQPAVNRPVVLQDTATGLQIILDRDLPASGYRQLLTLDLSKYRLGPLHYDRAQRCWRSELDEAVALPSEAAPAGQPSSSDPPDSPPGHTLPAAHPDGPSR